MRTMHSNADMMEQIIHCSPTKYDQLLEACKKSQTDFEKTQFDVNQTKEIIDLLGGLHFIIQSSLSNKNTTINDEKFEILKNLISNSYDVNSILINDNNSNANAINNSINT